MAQLLEYIKMALHNIKSNKGRSILTMLGIIIGIASVIMIMGIGNGVKGQMNSELSGIRNGQIHISLSGNAIDSDKLTEGDISALGEKIDNLKGITPIYSLLGNVYGKKENYDLKLTSGSEALQYTSDKGIIKGKYFTKEDVLSGNLVGVINKTDAIRLFGTCDVVGLYVEATFFNVTQNIKIVGVKDVSDNNLLLSSLKKSTKNIGIEMPYTALASFDIYVDSFSGLNIITEDGADSSQVAKSAIKILETRHNTAGEELFHLEDFNQYMSQVNSVLNIMTSFIAFVAAISLLVGGIGVMNIMLVSVTERTREIGIRKALGAKIHSIMVQFLLESAIITAIGGIIGIIIGTAGATVVCSLPMLKVSPGIKLSTVLLATLFSSFVGIFFGIYPARKAAKLSPIEALRRS